jgi:hypothetical protein
VLQLVGWSVKLAALEVLLLLMLEESGVIVWDWLYTGMGETDWLYNDIGGRVFWGWLYSDIDWLYKDTGGIAFWDWLYSSGFGMDSTEAEWVGDCNVVVSGKGDRAGVCWMAEPTDVDRIWNKTFYNGMFHNTIRISCKYFTLPLQLSHFS